MYRSPANFLFSFSLLRRYQIAYLNTSILPTTVFEHVQQFYHATKTGNVPNAVSACADQP